MVALTVTIAPMRFGCIVAVWSRMLPPMLTPIALQHSMPK